MRKNIVRGRYGKVWKGRKKVNERSEGKGGIIRGKANETRKGKEKDS